MSQQVFMTGPDGPLMFRSALLGRILIKCRLLTGRHDRRERNVSLERHVCDARPRKGFGHAAVRA